MKKFILILFLLFSTMCIGQHRYIQQNREEIRQYWIPFIQKGTLEIQDENDTLLYCYNKAENLYQYCYFFHDICYMYVIAGPDYLYQKTTKDLDKIFHKESFNFWKGTANGGQIWIRLYRYKDYFRVVQKFTIPETTK